MRFYSYNYLLEQIAKFDWWGTTLTIFLIICLIFTMYKYHQRQKETKFRELAIILGLGIVVMISIKISQYRVTQVNGNKYRQAIHFIEVVAEDLKTDKENIYINTSASIDGTLVRIGSLYYRVISGDNGKNYLLEKIDLNNPKIEIIEVKK
ncbi:hypothetical protein RO03_11690 [Fusobacterium nucleatum subsp. nucleatum]|uniref:DUF3290 domain-containing protein n=1 Tax=Fusobacterium nucleatum subsp. nucleatum TaxID=76856 RepID=A0A101K515_FUSNC|nr:DUF3290 domain-containing protein [Fusobacterium nucleatum]KUL97648.1 hypothetical protein RO03_11690 [Fusobacterium nucleatum subsp. nucleatum]